jgi:hypothetical protein
VNNEKEKGFIPCFETAIILTAIGSIIVLSKKKKT